MFSRSYALRTEASQLQQNLELRWFPSSSLGTQMTKL